MRIIASSGYPWDSEPSWTDTWVADERYVDSTLAVGTWSPSKGTIPLIQTSPTAKPSHAASWGSQNRGGIIWDGANDLLTGDALASKITPVQPFTMIAAFQALTAPAGTGETPWGFGASAAAATICLLQQDPTGVHPWRNINYDDAGNIKYTQQSVPVAANTSKIIISSVFDPGLVSNGWPTLRINGAVIAHTVASVPAAPVGASSFTKFTVGAHRGASTAQFINMKMRALLFAPIVMPTSALVAAENYLIAEAA